jgi:Zn-dependent alcohol dehydrogenase
LNHWGDFEDINQAMEDSLHGTTIKLVLWMGNEKN